MLTELPFSALFSPLLLATDGSPSARLAQTLIRSIAMLFTTPERSHQPDAPAIVLVLTVQPRPTKQLKRSTKKGNQPALDATSEPTREAAAAMATSSSGMERSQGGLSMEQLTELVAIDFPNNFPVSLQVRQGRAAIEILNCARTVEAGLIAVGHRGVGGVRELLLGSVSTAIARYAPCSVLVARTQAETAIEANLRHVLLIVDNSVAVRQAILTARQLIPTGIETITLLHIQPPLNASYLVTPLVSRMSSWQLSQSVRDAQREQGEHVLQKAAGMLQDLSDVTVQTRLHTGDAGPSICQTAQELGANLILIGSDAARRSLLSPLQSVRLPRRKQTEPNENRPILRNTRLSITDDYVIHYAPCPVLLCRAVAEEA